MLSAVPLLEWRESKVAKPRAFALSPGLTITTTVLSRFYYYCATTVLLEIGDRVERHRLGHAPSPLVGAAKVVAG